MTSLTQKSLFGIPHNEIEVANYRCWGEVVIYKSNQTCVRGDIVVR